MKKFKILLTILIKISYIIIKNLIRSNFNIKNWHHKIIQLAKLLPFPLQPTSKFTLYTYYTYIWACIYAYANISKTLHLALCSAASNPNIGTQCPTPTLLRKKLYVCSSFVCNCMHIFFFFFQANWFKAAQYCRFHGMHLASISSQEENDKLEKYVRDSGEYPTESYFNISTTSLLFWHSFFALFYLKVTAMSTFGRRALIWPRRETSSGCLLEGQ